MISLGLYLFAAGIVALTIESMGASFGALQRRGLDAPPRVGTLSRQEPVSPNPIIVRSLPTPARFRPLGPPMFDSPTIAS